MKKQFFYAALALAVMSGCTNENDPIADNGNQNVTPEEKVAIELGISTPNIAASTKSTGAVGGTEASGENLWNEQALFVWAYEKADATATAPFKMAVEPDMENPDDRSADNYIFEGVNFKAPKGNASGNITILADAQSTGSITEQYKYYTTNGKIDFYGFHVDDAKVGDAAYTFNNATDQGPASDDFKNKKVSNLLIDGSQDLMAAKTKEVNATTYTGTINWRANDGADDNAKWDNAEANAFSAWTQRRDITPILQFKHLLARFQFNVSAGSKEAAAAYNDEATANTGISATDYTDNMTAADITLDGKNNQPATSTAIQITSIKLYADVNETTTPKTYVQLPNKVTIDLDAQTAETVDPTTAIGDYILKQRNTTTGVMEDLSPTAPKAFAGHADNYIDETHPAKTPVGESLMIPAGLDKVYLVMTYQQVVVDTEKTEPGTDEKYGTEDDVKTYTYITKKGTYEKEIEYSSLANKTQATEGTGAAYSAFTAGEIYTLNITMFDFQRIEVTAELTPWVDGGNLDFDAE